MEIIGATKEIDGEDVDQFFIKCSTHDWFYKGLPPLTHGCADCWMCYYFGQMAQAGGDMTVKVDQLESAIKHAAELVDSGKWDFVPDHHVEIGKEN